MYFVGFLVVWGLSLGGGVGSVLGLGGTPPLGVGTFSSFKFVFGVGSVWHSVSKKF